jgi:copper chaperone CopZ
VASVIVATALFFPEQVVALVRGRAPTPAHAQATTVHRFTIEGMTCEACASTLERDLAGLGGVSGARVNFAARTAEVHGDDGSIVPEVVRAADRHGWRATPK